MLSLMLFLTVSFHSAPYYTGADIVFAFAWTPLLPAGSGSVLSLDAAIKNWAGQQVAAARQQGRRSRPAGPEVRRREVVLRGMTTAAVAAVSLAIGGLAAGLGGLAGGTAGQTGPSSLRRPPLPSGQRRPALAARRCPRRARFRPARPSARQPTCPSGRPPRSRIRPRAIRRS